MLKLIVFDCDGVMFDSKTANIKYYNALLAHFGFPPMDDEEVEFVHMQSVTASVAHIFRKHPQVALGEVHLYRESIGYAPFLPFMRMEEDLVDFLEIASKHYALAISTNRTNTMIPLLETFQLRHYFGKVVTAHTAKRPKPAPDGLLEILEHFQCQPQEAVFIGDSTIDQEHAASCRVPLIAFKSPKLAAVYHVQSFMQLIELPPFSQLRNNLDLP
jgi:phosphoglycolate phosphatase